MENHDILTIEEIAQYLRVSERTVYDWANKGSIPCGKLGTTWRFKRIEVERWVDQRLSPKRLAPDARDVSMREVLAPERVVLLESSTKAAALSEMISVMDGLSEIGDPEALRREIFHREELMSTGIGFNVAVPHVRLDSVSDLVMAVGISREPIEDYESLDEQPVRIICMVAARADQHAQYLKTLGTVSKALKPASVRASLLDTPDAKAAYLILTQ